MKNLSKDFLIISISLLLLVIISWYYLYLMTLSMDAPSMNMNMETEMAMNMDSSFNIFLMPMTGNWAMNDFIVMFLMWTIMMFAMMMPSTFIFINIFEMMRSNIKSVKHPLLELYVISFAYILIWTIFSIFATFLQYYLHNADMINMMGTLKHEMFAGIFLICAGVFQFSSLKNACLEKCRNPLSFIMGRKINNLGDVAKLGLAHGIFCLGCCWALMLLLFINGVMNLLWIVVLTIAVLAEKILPFEKLTSRFFGAVLVVWGAYLTFI